MNTHEILERFAELRTAGKRHKDAAKAIGISEGQAIAAHVAAAGRALQATPLRGPGSRCCKACKPAARCWP